MDRQGNGLQRIGSATFDASSGELRGPAGTSRLEPRAGCVLAALCEKLGATVPRQELLDRCWGEGAGSDEALTQAVAQIRRALGEAGASPSMVETLAKRGYRLVEASDTPPTEAPAAAPNRAVARLAVAGAVLLFVAWLAFAHGPRHFIRHALGFGPTADASH